MKIWKSVVGKLWMTIIGLVAVVLLINSLFMGQFIDNNFANSKDQEVNLQKVAVKIAEEVSQHAIDGGYVAIVNELLSAQDAALLLIDMNLQETSPGNESVQSLHVRNFFDDADLRELFQGETVSSIYTQSEDQRFLAVGVPLYQGGTIHGGAVLYQKQISIAYTQAYFKNLFFYAIVIGFLLTTFFAFFLSTRITKPLLQMKQAADRITEGDYRTKVYLSSNDEIGELSETFNHMTERLQTTVTDLNHEKEHLSSVLRSMNDAVITFDAEGFVILTNPQGEKIIREWNEIQWSEEGESKTFQIPEPLQPLFYSVVKGTKELTSKVLVRNEVWSVVMTPLYSNELVRGAVAVLRDVTEEHRLDKLRKDFVANVSHELRTPLSMLQGYSEALLDDIAGTPEERKEIAQVIHDESLRMGRLVKDLLDLARMEAGHLELNFHPVDLNALLKRVHRKFTVLCKERGITLTLEVENHPIILSKADDDRLEQVFTNLLDNAVRHTPSQANIAIRFHYLINVKEKAVRVEVIDEGKGIPQEDLPYIFERFYKADKARTRGTSGGTGLGLAIVKNIVDAHRGSVQASSVPGKGTTFAVTLPLS